MKTANRCKRAILLTNRVNKKIIIGQYWVAANWQSDVATATISNMS